MKEYIIKCDFYQKKPTCKVLGETTLAVVDEFDEKPTVTVYLRGYDNPSEPRLNVKEVAMKFNDKKEADRIASELSTTSFDEGKIIASVEEV